MRAGEDRPRSMARQQKDRNGKNPLLPGGLSEPATRFELATLTLAKCHRCSRDLGLHPFSLVRGHFE